MITMEANRLKQPPGGRARDSVAKVRSALAAERTLIDRQVVELLRSDDGWDGRLGLPTSVPGVGVTTAATLVAELPELGKLNRRQVASLACLTQSLSHALSRRVRRARADARWRANGRSVAAAARCGDGGAVNMSA